MDSKKSNKIREIVRLQQILKKWRNKATSSTKPTTTTTGSSKSVKFLKRTLSFTDNIPKGYLAVCIGEEEQRFIIPTSYLGHEAFRVLLREAEEEFGFNQVGILRIPCEVCVFETIVKIVEENKCEINGICSSQNSITHSQHPQSPMCR